MADPISVVSILAGSAIFVINCATMVRSLHRIACTFTEARLTVLSAIHELDTVRLAWQQIEQLLQRWKASDELDLEIIERLSQQLEFDALCINALARELPSIARKSYSFSQATKVVWNEGLFQAHQDRVRGQASAMTLLLSVLIM